MVISSILETPTPKLLQKGDPFFGVGENEEKDGIFRRLSLLVGRAGVKGLLPIFFKKSAALVLVSSRAGVGGPEPISLLFDSSPLMNSGTLVKAQLSKSNIFHRRSSKFLNSLIAFCALSTEAYRSMQTVARLFFLPLPM